MSDKETLDEKIIYFMETLYRDLSMGKKINKSIFRVLGDFDIKLEIKENGR